MTEIVKEYSINDNKINIHYQNGLHAKIYFYTENIVRMMVSHDEVFSNDPTLMNNFDVPKGEDITVASGGAGQQLKEKIIINSGRADKLPVEMTESGLTLDKYAINFDLESFGINIIQNHESYVFEQEKEPSFDSKNQFINFFIRSQSTEHFFGGGTQNGLLDLKGKKIKIENENTWTDGGVSSPVPFYFSTKGYGVLFNTFTKGTYDFSFPRTTTLKHEDTKLDCFILLGDTPSEIIHEYHLLTGLPTLNPLYTYYPAHLNAYNRDYWFEVTADSPAAISFPDGKFYKEYQPIREKTFNTGYRRGTITYLGIKYVPNVYLPGKVTFIYADIHGMPIIGVQESLNGEKNNYQFSARAVIDSYKKNDFPLGWFLPNDGYGAGYGQTDNLSDDIENLTKFGEYARHNGVELGLWTQENLIPKDEQHPEKNERYLAKEVELAGVRALKTDVAWVGEGYTFGLNGIAEATKIMNEKSAMRPFILTLDGWAGTQRYGSIWSGDQQGGDWQNIKFHIPTYLSTGVSGNPNVGADVDGIFGGGNPIILSRDLQWKSFTPIQLSMDGWGFAPRNYGITFADRLLDINRFYLKLKSQLLPYFYSTAFEARTKGTPILRPTFFDEQTQFTYGEALNYQFLLGKFLLVAPIFEPYKMDELGNDQRNGIYLPDESATWIDFFTGEKYQGGQTLPSFDAPIWKLPVFVKSGSIIPLFNASNNVTEIDRSKEEYLIYPGSDSQFCVYEDDGDSRQFENDKFITRMISQNQTEQYIDIIIQAAKGDYVGNHMNRFITLAVYMEKQPAEVQVNQQITDHYQFGNRVMDTFSQNNEHSFFQDKEICQGKFLNIFVSDYQISKPLKIRIIF